VTLRRLISKISTARAVARDLINLKYSLKTISQVKTELNSTQVKTLQGINSSLKELDDLCILIDNSINEDSSLHSENKGIIKQGYNKELDDIRYILNSGEAWLENYQRKERERTKINSLKVSFNKVFGYYIEISKANLDRIESAIGGAEGYIRKQTLVNAERFITQELKEYEEKILSANEKISTLEAKLFSEIREKITGYSSEIQMNAAMIGVLDVLLSFAETAEANRYYKPEVNDSDKIEIYEGRHPVIEQLLPAEKNMYRTIQFLTRKTNRY
jgi:DNA mismatch repair protein MutS